MKRKLVVAAAAGTALAGLGALALVTSTRSAKAADHRDGAAVKMDPSTDINDVYTWMNPAGDKVYVAMTVFPLATNTARFSNAAKYVFHLNSAAGYGMPAMETRVICTFDNAMPKQNASCWVTRGSQTLDYVTGDASGTNGILSTSMNTRLYAALRDDPFFFNLVGFQQVAAAVAQAAPSLTVDAAGCPNLPAATATALVNQLKQAMGGGPPQNFFAGKDTLVILLALDKTMVTPGGPIVGVWGSTNR